MMIKKVLNVFNKLISTSLILFLILTINVKASSFAYKDFNYDEFVENTKDYWGTACEDDEDTGKCIETITKNQKSYYTRLYKILAKYEEKGLHVDDKTIIATSFFEYSPENLKTGSSYNLDTDDISLFSIDKVESADYYLQERDTIKLLVNAMIGYERVCYGVTEATPTGSPEQESVNPETTQALNGITNKLGVITLQPEVSTDQDYACAQGVLRTINNKPVCLNEVKKDSIDFVEKYLGGLQSFFGIKKKDNYNCDDIAASYGYDESYLEESDEKKVVEEGYWDFLINGDYFDNKDILKHYYNLVLNKANKSSMSELTDSEKELYEEDIKKARTNIVNSIKSVLGTKEDGTITYTKTTSNASFWWPIGSKETTEDAGKKFASGAPESTVITSKYGMRKDPVTHQYTSLHSGVDLGGTLAETNIIAAKDGTVISVNDTCESFGETTCGGHAGNYILILHTDGMYSFYGHLHQKTITVKEGDSVAQGQVIGKMGSSGWSTGPHLHFEIRTGPSNSSAVDPLGYIDPNNTRPSGVSKVTEFIGTLEGGSRAEDGNYVVDCVPGDIPTVGHGITLANNVNQFAEEGIMLKTSYSGKDAYKEYCGKKFEEALIDRIYEKVISRHVNAVKQALSNHELTLEPHQIDALTSLNYNTGNINGFYDAYASYKSASSICTSWWHEYIIMKGSNFELGLRRRRKSECHLYTTGDYNARYGWEN